MENNSSFDFDRFKIACADSITFYEYRQAQPKMPIISLNRYDKMVEEFELFLYDRVKVGGRDNHTLFELKYNGNTIVFQFTDREMIIGLGIIKEPW